MVTRETPYLNVVQTCLPSFLACQDHTQDLDSLLRFAVGGSVPHHLDSAQQDEWRSCQAKLHTAVDALEQRSDNSTASLNANGKRNAAGPTTDGDAPEGKKPKTSNGEFKDDSEALYTLHGISVGAPVRKKLDISLTSESLRLHASSSTIATPPPDRDVVATIPMSSLSRAFLLASTAKNSNKEKWSVLLVGDEDPWSAERDAKKQRGADAQKPPVQIMFSVDAVPGKGKPAIQTSRHKSYQGDVPSSGDAYAILSDFLSRLPAHIKVSEAVSPNSTSASLADSPSPKAAFLSSKSQPSIAAYRGAKEGSLYFLRDGVLFAEARPVAFFALSDIVPYDRDDADANNDANGAYGGHGGVRTLSATGRTFSVFITKKGDDEGEPGEEVEFSMIDGREQENVLQWIRTYRQLFGKVNKVQPGPSGSGASATQKGTSGTADAPGDIPDDDDEDESDEDFVAESDSDGGSPSEDEGSSDEEGEGGSGNDDAEGEAETEEEDVGGLGEAEDDDSDKHHPLRKPGILPKTARISRGVIDAVVGMFDEASAEGERAVADDEMDAEDERDELDD